MPQKSRETIMQEGVEGRIRSLLVSASSQVTPIQDFFRAVRRRSAGRSTSTTTVTLGSVVVATVSRTWGLTTCRTGLLSANALRAKRVSA